MKILLNWVEFKKSLDENYGGVFWNESVLEMGLILNIHFFQMNFSMLAIQGSFFQSNRGIYSG
jgi:hypothetical protein